MVISTVREEVHDADDKRNDMELKKMMGQNVGFRVFLAGRHYTVIAFGRDDDREDTKAEFDVFPES